MDKTFYNVIFYCMIVFIIIGCVLFGISMLNSDNEKILIYISLTICVLLLVYVIVYGFTNLSYKINNGNSGNYTITKPRKFKNKKWNEYGVFYIYTDKSSRNTEELNNELLIQMIDKEENTTDVVKLNYDIDNKNLTVTDLDDTIINNTDLSYKLSYNDFKNYILGHVILNKKNDKLNLTISLNKKIIYDRNIPTVNYEDKKINLQISELSNSNNKYNVKSLKDPRWMYNDENTNNILYKMNN